MTKLSNKQIQPQASVWHRWLRHPQKLTFRKALFQIHLWSGLGLGFYIFFISITGSVLVYRNELYVAFTPSPIISITPSPVMNNVQLSEAALQSYPEYSVTRIIRARNPDQAVEIWLEQVSHKSSVKKRLFDPRSGEDVGNATAYGIIFVSNLIKLHQDFLVGPTGRTLNGVAAFAVLLVIFTGILIWWPGLTRWQRSLTLHKGVGWRRLTWDFHSMLGFWSFGFLLIFTVSGIYLCFSETFHALAEYIEPMTQENAGRRLVDDVLYWLAFLHFGRINGIGISCNGPGFCDQSVKAIWALFGLAPAAMFVTGSTMWWNRVLSRCYYRIRNKNLT